MPNNLSVFDKKIASFTHLKIFSTFTHKLRLMKLRRDYIDSLSERLLHRLLQKNLIRLHVAPKVVQARIVSAITSDLKIEDDLDEEVRKILEGYAQQMRQQHIEYHEMFQMVKRKLIKERNLVL
ncbi:hypothetical protein CSA56_05045 [candidate division KSB3 bacterium]|uniref:DUF507 domain-containing protein n=1 Tax=candidate division KSB3 bacterium TaxID=2044937 RepID=A0A2G6KHZ4_9BACT|nr:MAG: hypothetical protein CSA56_05045 [candidate division KSB3 bacterium]